GPAGSRYRKARRTGAAFIAQAQIPEELDATDAGIDIDLGRLLGFFFFFGVLRSLQGLAPPLGPLLQAFFFARLLERLIFVVGRHPFVSKLVEQLVNDFALRKRTVRRKTKPSGRDKRRRRSSK